MNSVVAFPSTASDCHTRMQEFIAWGRPGGHSGLNTHTPDYRDADPWYAWSSDYWRTANSLKTALVRSEFLAQDARALSRPKSGKGRPVITRPECLIDTAWFIAFAKAYLNVLASFKGVRSGLKATVYALSAFEGALRELGLIEQQSFADVGPGVFAKAADILASLESKRSYDAAKELEILAGLLQTGFHSKTLRLDGYGFRLVARSFSFKSPIGQRKPERARVLDPARIAAAAEARLSNEVVAAVGQAYRLSLARFGRNHPVSTAAAMIALPLTSTSMRVSDLLQLRQQCVVHDTDTGRWRILVYRPKIRRYQNVPIPKVLGDLADELANLIRTNTQPAREALESYVTIFGDDFSSIDQLFIPPQFRPYFEPEFQAWPQFRGGGLVPSSRIESEEQDALAVPPIPNTIRKKIPSKAGILAPGDIFGSLSFKALYLQAEQIKRLLRSIRVPLPQLLDAVDDHLFVADYWVREIVARHGDQSRRHATLLSIHCLFTFEGKQPRVLFRTADLKAFLLNDFKSVVPAHWPHTTSDRMMKVHEALFVGFGLRGVHHEQLHTSQGHWWLPRTLTEHNITLWSCGSPSASSRAPLLFSVLGVKLADGEYPRLTLHETRKYFQTQALLSGVHETFIDELAGRQSGRQSAHYDLRTPDEIVRSSIELFDPNGALNVVGPVAHAAEQIPVVDRMAFLYSNAAPKQFTEVGGCSTSWSVNPCHKHGSCMRCESAVWRKGDSKRLPRIHFLREQSIKLIAKGELLLQNGGVPEPIRRHIQQNQDVVDRCDAILAAEADTSLVSGSLVTFGAAESAVGAPELLTQLRAAHNALNAAAPKTVEG